MGDIGPALQFQRLHPALVDGLFDLLAAVEAGGEADRFRPHAFDRAHLAALAGGKGRDLYYVALLDDRVAAYGLLRGWDEGYEVPSLGIAVHPDCRGTGLGAAMMQFLHAAARLRGSRKVRLRVVDGNAVAVRLYERTGYRFEGDAERDAAGQRLLTGYKDLAE